MPEGVSPRPSPRKASLERGYGSGDPAAEKVSVREDQGEEGSKPDARIARAKALS